MQCPACKYEAPQSAFGDPLRCPECGAYYEKAVAHALAKPARPEPIKQVSEPQQSRPPALDLHPHVAKAVSDNRGAQPVAVVDLQMSFNSMVWFMVKWVIASIPAMIILGLIVLFLSMVIGGAASLGV